jgi:hypothetical protein
VQPVQDGLDHPAQQPGHDPADDQDEQEHEDLGDRMRDGVDQVLDALPEIYVDRQRVRSHAAPRIRQ